MMTVRGRCVVGAAAGHRGGGRGRRFLDSAPRRHRHAAQHAAPARHVCTQRGTPKALTTRWNSGSRADSRLAAVAGVGGSSEGEDGAHGGGAHSSGRADSHAAPVTYGEDYGTILNIAVPAFFSLMLDPLMAAVDAAIVGRLGPIAMAATGISNMVFSYSSMLFNFMAVITVPNVASALARGDRSAASQFVSGTLWLAWLVGSCVSLGMWFGAEHIILSAGTEPGLQAEAIACLRARSFSVPAVLSCMACNGVFRAYKDTRTPLLLTGVANLLNLAMDLVFVFCLGWGAPGAALATAISVWVAFLALLSTLLYKGLIQPSDLAKHPSAVLLLDILRQGFAVSVRSIGLFVFLSSAGLAVNKLGAVPLAVHEIVRQLWFASVMMFESFNVATQTLVAGVIGAGDRRKARRILRRTSLAVIAAGCLTSAFVFTLRYKIAAVFTTSPEVIALVAQMLVLCSVFFPIDGLVLILEGALTGAMQVGFVARSVAVSSILGVLLLNLVPLCTASVLGVWVAMKAMMVLRLGSASARLLSRQSPLYVQPAHS
eukprot:jgi/Tetstr1/440800/TSEL_029107.t1